ncbi:MAG: hypothetical protein ACREGB_02510 [Candidatus Saccharimonadales bacterium]
MAKTSYDRQGLRYIPWLLSTAVSLVALFVWAQSFDWQFSTVSTYAFFPVLGLLAFSIMWSHYMVGEMRRTFLHGVDLHQFFRWTGYAVLVLIVFHPGLLIYQRFRDGFGLPPHSYETYVAPSMAWLTLLGSVSLLIFLAFELKRWFARKNWWKYVLYLNDLAMLAIFYHGLELGTQTHIKWFRYIWWFYGITLTISILHAYTVRIQQHSAHAS